MEADRWRSAALNENADLTSTINHCSSTPKVLALLELSTFAIKKQLYGAQAKERIFFLCCSDLFGVDADLRKKEKKESHIKRDLEKVQKTFNMVPL